MQSIPSSVSYLKGGKWQCPCSVAKCESPPKSVFAIPSCCCKNSDEAHRSKEVVVLGVDHLSLGTKVSFHHSGQRHGGTTHILHPSYVKRLSLESTRPKGTAELPFATAHFYLRQSSLHLKVLGRVCVCVCVCAIWFETNIDQTVDINQWLRMPDI